MVMNNPTFSKMVDLSALYVYDLCKAVSQGIAIRDIRLWKKNGGKRDYRA